MNSIIIPTYCPTADVEEKLLRCLYSIRNNTVEPYQLVIVNNGSTVLGVDNSSCDLFISSFEPLGFARAVNIGVYASIGENLFIVNNDIVVPPRWDTKLLAAYESVSKCGLISPEDRPAYTGLQLNVSWWSCVLIKRAVWDDVGPLDDRLLNYRFHDQDWSIRCKQKGYEVARYGGAQVLHDEASTYRHMKVDEGAERDEMVCRYGVAHFYEWIQRHS